MNDYITVYFNGGALDVHKDTAKTLGISNGHQTNHTFVLISGQQPQHDRVCSRE